jgi:hypothetical protein
MAHAYKNPQKTVKSWKKRLKGENGTRNEKQERKTLDVQVECQEPSETLIEINKSNRILENTFE